MSDGVTDSASDATGDASVAVLKGAHPDAASAPSDVKGLLSFGAALSAAREATGISVGEMASRLRLHPRQIAALEAEQLGVLPEPTFVRGFIRNFAKEVRLDPAPLLASFDARVGPATPMRAIGQGTSKIVQAAERERISRQLVVLGGVGLLIVLGAIGWLASQRPATPPTPPPQAAVAPTPMPPVVAAGSDQAGTSVTPPAAPEGAATPSGSAAVAAPGSDTAVAPRPEPTDGARPAPAAASGSPMLRLTVGERPSWVEVIQQVDGRVVYSGLIEPNAERRVAVVPPVRLTVGNASVVKLEYRGKPVELAPHVRAEDVARLTLD